MPKRYERENGGAGAKIEAKRDGKKGNLKPIERKRENQEEKTSIGTMGGGGGKRERCFRLHVDY